jgi:hypothetical protein
VQAQKFAPLLFVVTIAALVGTSCDIILHIEGNVYTDAKPGSTTSIASRVDGPNVEAPASFVPLAGATITIIHQRGTETVVSDERGHFAFRSTTSFGSAIIRCSKKGFQSCEYRRAAMEAPPINVRFVLRPVQGVK